VPHSNPKLYIHPLRQIPRDVSIVNNPSIKYILTVHVSRAVTLLSIKYYNLRSMFELFLSGSFWFLVIIQIFF